MKWEAGELRQFLREDAVLRVLIVEGRFDISLWKYLVPPTDRLNVAVYPASDFNIAVEEGGEKARLVALAQLASEWDEFERLRFFADTDLDRFLGTAPTQGVTLTDGRDAESYTLAPDVMSCLCETGAGENAIEAENLRQLVRDLLRPIGILRIVSGKRQWRLPFQDTFYGGTIKRFFRKRGRIYSLKLDPLLDALLSRMENPPVTGNAIVQAMNDEAELLIGEPDFHIVHGKDLISLVAYYFNIEYPIATGLVALSISSCSASVRSFPNIGTIDQWLRANRPSAVN